MGAALGGNRFLSEIRSTARLQHPQILPLLDSGEADGLLSYVMPLVTGETLCARLEHERQLPIAEAVRIALAVQTAGGARMTQKGLPLGTPQYMSPEQAMGERQIDARSDVYARAAVTYEMLAGNPPFAGGSVQAIAAKIMSEKPTSIHTLRDTVSEPVESAVLTGLAKVPADRFATAAAFAAAFAAALATPSEGRLSTRVSAAPRATGLSRRASGLLLAAMGVVTVPALAFAAWNRTASGASARVVRYELTTPAGQQLVSPGGTRFAWSPDGEAYVYTGVGACSKELWSRRLDALEAVPIRGSDKASSRAFPPDGSEIAFVTLAPFAIAVPPTAGGPTLVVVPASIEAAGGWLSW